jgi:hypothetical protein
VKPDYFIYGRVVGVSMHPKLILMNEVFCGSCFSLIHFLTNVCHAVTNVRVLCFGDQKTKQQVLRLHTTVKADNSFFVFYSKESGTLPILFEIIAANNGSKFDRKLKRVA